MIRQKKCRVLPYRLEEIEKISRYIFSIFSDILAAGFGNPADSHIDIGDLIPGGIVCNAGSRQPEDSLEAPDALSCAGTVDYVSYQDRDGREIAGNAV